MQPPHSKNSKNKLWLICGALIALIAIGEITGLRTSFSFGSIKEIFLQNKLTGVIIFSLVFALGNLLYVPGWIFLVAAVLALGKEWGGLATYTAAMVSAILSYALIFKLGKDALRSFDNKWANKIFSNLDHSPIVSIVLLRLLFQTAPPLNYALAMSNIRFRHYLLGTLLGLPLPIFIYCYFFEFIFDRVLAGIG